MNARISLAVLAALALSDACRADELRLSSAVVGPVSVETAEGPWRTVARVEGCADGIDELSVSLAADTDRPATVGVFDTFGLPIGTAQDLPRGIHDVSCPVSGYLFIRK